MCLCQFSWISSKTEPVQMDIGGHLWMASEWWQQIFFSLSRLVQQILFTLLSSSTVINYVLVHRYIIITSIIKWQHLRCWCYTGNNRIVSFHTSIYQKWIMHIAWHGKFRMLYGDLCLYVWSHIRLNTDHKHDSKNLFKLLNIFKKLFMIQKSRV